LSQIKSTIGTGDEDGIGIATDDTNKDMPSLATGDWWSRLGSSTAWPWVIVCVVVVLSLCIMLILMSRNGAGSKQMSDLDVLDNYKQGWHNSMAFSKNLSRLSHFEDTISPDYSHSFGGATKAIGCLGQSNTMNSGLRKKMHTPLIRAGPACYGTHRSAVVVTSGGAGAQLRTPLSARQQQQQQPHKYKMYVDPTTYEDPAEILAEFTNEIRPEDVEVTRVVGAGEFGEVCCGRLTVEDSAGQTQVVNSLNLWNYFH
jgi:hypothetical protein